LARPPAEFTFGHYRRIVESGLESGYRFICFDELARAREADGYFCLLRHDCEGDLATALQLGKLEREMGVTSTYFVQLRSPLYNVLSSPHGKLIRKLLDLGHRLGLHFDERSADHAPPATIPDLVDKERALLSAEFGVPVDAVSFHQPTAVVLENNVKIRCLNTYDRQDMAGFGYLSDSSWHWREDPVEAFRSRSHAKLQLLLHPECWTDRSMTVQEKWHKVLRDNLEIAQDTLLERETTYKKRAKISFRS